MEKIRIGIAGLGLTGRIHALNVLKQPAAALTAIADPDEEAIGLLEKEAEQTADSTALDALREAVRFDGIDEMLDRGKMDAVILCLPTYLHEPMAKKIFEKKLHLLCEKPIALDLAGADAMIAASENADRLFMVAHCLRFWPEYIYLRNCHLKNRYGNFASLNLWRISKMPDWSSQNWLLDRRLSGGPPIDLQIHDLDFTLSLFGRPDKIVASGRGFKDQDRLDILHTQLHYDPGYQVHIHCGWSTAPVPFDAGYEAWFQKGFVRYSNRSDPTLEVYVTGKKNSKTEAVPPWDAYEEEIRYFLSCIQTGTAPELCKPGDARTALALAYKTLEAARSGKAVNGEDLK